MQNKHPIIRSLLNHHRYQHQEEQAKHSQKKTIRDTTKHSPTHLVKSYTPPTFKPEDTIHQVYNQFKEEMIRMLDAVASQKTIKTTEKL